MHVHTHTLVYTHYIIFSCYINTNHAVGDLLVCLEDQQQDGNYGTGGRGQAASPQPQVGQIISLDEGPLDEHHGEVEEDEEGRDDSVLVKSSAVLEGPHEAELKVQRPPKPAPPKTRPPKFRRPPPPAMNKKKTAPSSGITKVSSSGELSPSSPTHSSPPQLTHLIVSTSTDIPLILDSTTTTTGSKTHPPPKPPRSALYDTGQPCLMQVSLVYCRSALLIAGQPCLCSTSMMFSTYYNY